MELVRAGLKLAFRLTTKPKAKLRAASEEQHQRIAGKYPQGVAQADRRPKAGRQTDYVASPPEPFALRRKLAAL
jgi:hypothetical protein